VSDVIKIAITVPYTLSSKFLTHPILMRHSRILSICLICLSVAACNTQEQAVHVQITDKIKTAPEKTATQKPTTVKARPAINLSIDDMHIDHHIDDDNFLNTGKEPTKKNNTLFEILGKNQIERKINLSGKLLTDEDKVENKEYLESVDGVQINIEGSFN